MQRQLRQIAVADMIRKSDDIHQKPDKISDQSAKKLC